MTLFDKHNICSQLMFDEFFCDFSNLHYEVEVDSDQDTQKYLRVLLSYKHDNTKPTKILYVILEYEGIHASFLDKFSVKINEETLKVIIDPNYPNIHKDSLRVFVYKKLIQMLL